MLSVNKKLELLNFELVQAEEEGKEVKDLKERFNSLDVSKIKQEDLDKLYEDISSAPMVAGWKYVEPDDFDEIKRQARFK